MTVRRQGGNQTDSLRDESAERCANQSSLEEGGCTAYMTYSTCVFWYTCEMYQKYMFLQWKHSEKHSENTSKTVHFK
jgi:hypothetical protein